MTITCPENPPSDDEGHEKSCCRSGYAVDSETGEILPNTG